MKGIDLFCASPASTAICVSTDQHSMIRHGGSRAIDRHNPHLRDGRRSRTATTTTINHLTQLSSSSSQSQPQPPAKPTKKSYYHKSRSGKKTSNYTSSSSNANDLQTTSPTGSSRYLLSDTPFLDVLTEFEPLPSSSLVRNESTRFHSVKSDRYPTFQPPSSCSSSSSCTTTTSNDHQVVVLRVSLHCKGCEGKVRKHISKMKGVTSFNIDFAMKKVTVTGDVTPLGVLTSISRVKNAQFWPSLSSSSSTNSTY